MFNLSRNRSAGTAGLSFGLQLVRAKAHALPSPSQWPSGRKSSEHSSLPLPQPLGLFPSSTPASRIYALTVLNTLRACHPPPSATVGCGKPRKGHG